MQDIHVTPPSLRRAGFAELQAIYYAEARKQYWRGAFHAVALVALVAVCFA